MFKKFIKQFLGRGLGKSAIAKYLSKTFIFVFNPFTIEGSKLYLPQDEIQFLLGYDPIKKDAFKQVVKENDVVVDLGAHIGYYTMLAAKLVGPGGKVYAFEPYKNNFDLLKKNKEKNKYDNIVLENKAVVDKTKEGEIYTWHESRYHSLYVKEDKSSQKIQMVSLDDYFKNYSGKIDVIKINIMGSEGLAIKGMTEVLGKNKDLKIFMYFTPGRIKELGDNPMDCLNILKELGFKVKWLITKNKLEEAPETIEELVNSDDTKELFLTR